MQAVVLSKKGTKSEKNEDACLSLPSRGLFVVADGVGGGPSGDFASRTVVDTLYQALTSKDCSREVILNAIELANERVFEAARHNNRKGMASTIVVGWCHQGQFLCFNAGDSRGYRIRGDKIERLTRDHTRQVQKAPNVVKQMVTNAIGVRPEINIEVTSNDIQKGDIFLLSSDGISDQLDDDTLLEVVRAGHLSLAEKATALIEASEQRGGNDDKSLILIINA